MRQRAVVMTDAMWDDVGIAADDDGISAGEWVRAVVQARLTGSRTTRQDSAEAHRMVLDAVALAARYQDNPWRRDWASRNPSPVTWSGDALYIDMDNFAAETWNRPRGADGRARVNDPVIIRRARIRLILQAHGGTNVVVAREGGGEPVQRIALPIAAVEERMEAAAAWERGLSDAGKAAAVRTQDRRDAERWNRYVNRREDEHLS